MSDRLRERADGTALGTDEGLEPAAAPGPALRAEGVNVAYGGVSVLEDVSLRLDPGTVTTLIGPNGSGKTTLIRVLAGLETPDAGTVTVDATARRPIGYHPQRPAFRSHESVREVLSYYAAIAGDETPTDERLATVGLDEVADRRVDALSGGMVRLLAVAQATIGDPPVVLLDEPTSDLDPDMSGAIAEVIAALADRGAAVLAVTHDLLAVEAIADEVVLLDRGSIVARGTPAALLERAGTTDLPAAFSALTRGETATWTVRSGTGLGDDAGPAPRDASGATPSDPTADGADGPGGRETGERDPSGGDTP